MKTLNTILFGSFIAMTTISSTALADEQGFYAGVNIGNGNLNLSTTNGTDKSSSIVGGGVLGYKFNKYLAVEGQYTGAGKVTDKISGTVKADAASLTAVGFLPLNDEFNLYGKLGIASVKSKVSSNLAPMNDATRIAATYGLGGEYNLNKNIGLRLGWDHYSAAVDTNASSTKNVSANVVSVGAVYNF